MKKEKRDRKENSSEYLSNDILEEDFVDMFSHYLTVMKIFGLSRVDARDRFVTAPTRPQKCYAVLCAGVALASLAFPFFYSVEPHLKNNLIECVASFLAVGNSVFMSVYARFINNQENVKLYIKMQRIDRLMGLQRHALLYRAIRAFNLAFLYFFVVLFLIILAGAYTDGTRSFLLFFRMSLCRLVVGIDLSYCSNMIIFFYIRLCFIKSILLNHVGKSGNGKSRFDWIFAKWIRKMAAKSHDFRSCELDVYLRELLQCFSDFRTLHELPIALYIVNLFCSTMINIEFVITKVQMNVRDTLERKEYCSAVFSDVQQAFDKELSMNVKYLAPVFLTTSMLHLILLCLRFDIFYREVKEVKRSIVAVMSYHFDGPLYERARRMWKLLEPVPAGFSVYGVWQIDAVFLLHFFNVSTTILFTQLQFAFL